MAKGSFKDALAKMIDLDSGPDSDFPPIDDFTYSIRPGVFLTSRLDSMYNSSSITGVVQNHSIVHMRCTVADWSNTRSIHT